ncbi:MAG TPA: GNAT family N-acetyltransferase [Burkholderiales bacterium]
MTASTEHALGPQHVAGCFALSKAANWNQNEADWRLMLAMGHGWGISLDDGTLAASTLVLPYGEFAWISMVLVLPTQRRKGHASRLLRVAIADLTSKRMTPILDATPAGREVYRQEGFRDTWSFKRFALRQPIRMPAAKSARPIGADWHGLLALDTEAFGGNRESLLRALQARLPHCALAAGDEGFVLGREGREAQQIGPLIARDERTALALLEQALQAVPTPPLYVDVVDHAPRLQQRLQQRGFVFQRPFTRMVHGGGRAPGNEKLVYLVAGPELG